MLRQQLAQREAGQGIIPSLEVFQHAQQHYSYFRSMLRGRAREALWDAAQVAPRRAIEQELAPRFAKQAAVSVPLTVASQFLAGAFLNLLTWWIEAEMPYSPEQMNAMFQQLALPGVGAALER
jgi:hypothetical protein